MVWNFRGMLSPSLFVGLFVVEVVDVLKNCDRTDTKKPLTIFMATNNKRHTILVFVSYLFSAVMLSVHMLFIRPIRWEIAFSSANLSELKERSNVQLLWMTWREGLTLNENGGRSMAFLNWFKTCFSAANVAPKDWRRIFVDVAFLSFCYKP